MRTGEERRDAMVDAIRQRVPARPRRDPARRPPRWIWLAIAAVVGVGAVGLAVRGYLGGGGRLRLAEVPVSGPVQIGTEFHVVSEFTVVTGAVRIRSVRAIADPGLDVVVRIVRLPAGDNGGSLDGPLPPGVVAAGMVPGLRLPQTAPGGARYAIDLRVVPRTQGVHLIRGVEVDYDAGRFRHRTATDRNRVCVDGLASKPTAPATGC
jgi:hypothetical protein